MMYSDPTGHDSVPVTVYLPNGTSYTTTVVNGATQTGTHGVLPVGAVVQTSSGASWQVQQSGQPGVSVTTVPIAVPAPGGSTINTVATVTDGHAYTLAGRPVTDTNGTVVYTAGGTYKVEDGKGVPISNGSTGESTGSTSSGNQKATNEITDTQETYPNTIVFQSDRPAGYDQYGDIAPDMMYDNYTKEALLALNSRFENELGKDAEALFSEFEDMVKTWFAHGELLSVVLDMIDHFKNGDGTPYQNETLTLYVLNHPTTQTYISLVLQEVISELVKTKGNLSALEFINGNALDSYIQSNAEYPHFDSLSDTWGGLRIAINDTWGNSIQVKNYSVTDTSFSGLLSFSIYDHFGLDTADIEKFGGYSGFRSWFVLQKYTGFEGAYKPFVTRMNFDIPFSGELI